MRSLILSCATLASALLLSPRASAYGEESGGFPKWSERVLHEWTNRARSEPAVEMQACGTACGEKGTTQSPCYTPAAPLVWEPKLGRAARFHADNMQKMSFFAHDSKCTLVSGIDAAYPSTCQGESACACEPNTTTCCVQGTTGCNAPPYCTKWNARVNLFAVSPSAEIIAGASDPNSAFYQWLFEPWSGTTCAYTSTTSGTNGHRWSLLKQTGRIGFGVASRSVGDFASGGTAQKIPSGSHYPKQAASVDAWANWYDAAAPQAARVNVDGTCTAMTRMRGTDTNGAWRASITGVGTGCHRYFFEFVDSGGATVTYPTTGSLGIGDATCADWSATRPSSGTGCGSGGSSSGGSSSGGSSSGGSSSGGSSSGGTDAGSSGGTDAGSSGGTDAGSSGGTSSSSSSGDVPIEGDPAASSGGAAASSGEPPPPDLASAPLPSSGEGAGGAESSGGCAIATTPSSRALAWSAVALVGLAAAAARRRRART